MENWNKRPQILANLFNPAFCGLVLAIAIQQYEKYSSKGMPYTLLSIILPMVLPQGVRESFPSTTSTKLYNWVRTNEQVLIDFPRSVQDIVGYTNEAVMFLMGQEWINVDDDGLFHYIYTRKDLLSLYKEGEALDILKSAKMLGKWFSITGSDSLIFSYLKIRP